MRRTSLRVRLGTPVCVTLLAAFGPANSFRTIQSATPDQTLRMAGEYVQQYERAIQGLVVQEDYRQVVISNRQGATGGGSRQLRSDLLVFNGGTMNEEYALEPSRQMIAGHASYSDFRQFAVTTSEGAK